MLHLAIASTPRRAAAAVAAFITSALRDNTDLVLGLPTGRTPVQVYRDLVGKHRAGRAEFSRARTFNLDEFVGIASDDARSYCAFMRRHFFRHVNLRPHAIHVPDGCASDLRAAARAYDAALAEAGGLDICLLGIGANGHIGFNEPAAALRADTHVATLAPGTRASNAELFGGRMRDVPRQGLTLGMGGILGARAVVLLATGAGKADIVRRALTGPITTRVPASFLQAHPNAIAVLDRAAASRLPHAAPRRRRR